MPIRGADGIRVEDKIDFQTGIVPADGTKAANRIQQRHRYVAVFGQLFELRASHRLPLFIYVGYRDQSTMASRKLNSSAAWANLEPCAGLTVVAMARHANIFNQKREYEMKTKIDVPPAPIVLLTDDARQGVTGHNVRYVLGFGIGGVVIGLVLIGFIASQGWLGAL